MAKARAILGERCDDDREGMTWCAVSSGIYGKAHGCVLAFHSFVYFTIGLLFWNLTISHWQMPCGRGGTGRGQISDCWFTARNPRAGQIVWAISTGIAVPCAKMPSDSNRFWSKKKKNHEGLTRQKYEWRHYSLLYMTLQVKALFPFIWILFNRLIICQAQGQMKTNYNSGAIVRYRFKH